MNKRAVIIAAAAGILALGTAGVVAIRTMTSPPPPVNPVTAGEGAAVMLLDFSSPFPLSPPPPGWWHQTFLTKAPMRLSFAEKASVKALRCETSGSGSIFGRHTDVDLGKFPHLAWSWLVETPVVAAAPEGESAGDDHPARFLLKLTDTQAAEHHMEIIWSNGAFKAGEWKYIGGFPHYVANGGDAQAGENSGVWFSEKVNLLELYRTAFKRGDAPRLSYIAIFCDTDDTGARSVAYFSGAELQR